MILWTALFAFLRPHRLVPLDSPSVAQVLDDISLEKASGADDQLSPELLTESQTSFESVPQNLFAQNAVTRRDANSRVPGVL